MNTNSLIGQYILSQSKSYLPENWIVRHHDSWWLASHETLPVIQIIASDFSHIGWLLGYPITLNGKLIKKSLQMSVFPKNNNALSQFESCFYTFGGSFVGVFLTVRFLKLC